MIILIWDSNQQQKTTDDLLVLQCFLINPVSEGALNWDFMFYKTWIKIK